MLPCLATSNSNTQECVVAVAPLSVATISPAKSMATSGAMFPARQPINNVYIPSYTVSFRASNAHGLACACSFPLRSNALSRVVTYLRKLLLPKPKWPPVRPTSPQTPVGSNPRVVPPSLNGETTLIVNTVSRVIRYLVAEAGSFCGPQPEVPDPEVWRERDKV